MRLIKFIILLLITAPMSLVAQSPAPMSEGDAYLQLQHISSEKLNINSPLPDAPLIEMAYRVEDMASRSGNLGHEFKANQVLVKTYGLSGNVALAVNKAQQMLEYALKNTQPIATGLALEAIGDTYMHSQRFNEADSIYTLATPYIFAHGDRFMQIQLLFEHQNAKLGKRDTNGSLELINKAYSILDQSPELACRQVYYLMLISRQVRLATLEGKKQKALEFIAELENKIPEDPIYQLLAQTISARCYSAFEQYNEALIHCDAALSIASTWPHGLFHHNYMLFRAQLLEKLGRNVEACDNYRKINVLTDSMHQSQYTSQIDSLHIAYWSDNMAISTILHRNSVFTSLIGGMLGIVIVVLIVGFIVRRQNRQLRQSRSDLELMRERSADSIRTKSLFLSNMSHELRTPLNAIVGFSSILTECEEIDEQTRLQCSSYIHQNGDLLQKLISDVVDFSQLQDQGIRFSFAPCDVVALCRNVLKTINNVKHTEALLKFDCDMTELTISADKDRLQQVLINLLINATKFTPSGTITLSLRIDEQQKEAVFAVEDTGCGIPLDRQPRIFERFEKLHEGIQGAGLGLSICKLIVDYTGGRIWIDSQYTMGARFVFTHPLKFSPNESQL